MLEKSVGDDEVMVDAEVNEALAIVDCFRGLLCECGVVFVEGVRSNAVLFGCVLLLDAGVGVAKCECDAVGRIRCVLGGEGVIKEIFFLVWAAGVRGVVTYDVDRDGCVQAAADDAVIDRLNVGNIIEQFGFDEKSYACGVLQIKVKARGATKEPSVSAAFFSAIGADMGFL